MSALFSSQGDAYETLFLEASARYPGDFKLLQSRLQNSDKNASQRSAKAKAIVDAANAIIYSINAEEIAAYFGTRVRRNMC